MKNYIEETNVGDRYRQEYKDGIDRLIAKKRQEAEKSRTAFFKDIYTKQEEYRQQFINMLGWPLTEKQSHTPPKVKKEFVAKDDNSSIYRLQIEVFEDLYFYGLLFVRDETKRLPLVISQHGGTGTPEKCSGLFESGSANYNDMTQRILSYDVNVFAPQMLLWNQEEYPVEYNRNNIDGALRQLGGSITALEIDALMKSLDYLSSLDFIDEEKIGMVGLSYGGFYTLFTAAIDKRIKSCISSGYFNDRTEYDDFIDWKWFNAANHFLDSEIAMLVYPRKLCIQVGEDDELFLVPRAIKEYERLTAYNHESNWLRFMTFKGGHEFCKDDHPIQQLVRDLCEQE